jgi:hypothetical protein
MDETELPTGFEELSTEDMQERTAAEQGFDDLYAQQSGYFSEQRKALNTTTLLTALARADPSKNIAYQLGESALVESRKLLEAGQEKQLRYQLVVDRKAAQLANLSQLQKGLDYAPNPELVKGAHQAYSDVMQWDTERRSRAALEEAAIDRIQQMAASDPIQAQVLLDNLEKGDADQTIRNFAVKLSMLQQRAEELDEKYQQSGWGRFMLNAVMNLVPGNYNLQRTGIIGTAGIMDFLGVGNAQRRESETMWGNLMNMSVEEASEYLASDGELMRSIADNAQSPFDLVDDPGAAVEIMDNLITLGDKDRAYNNLWGGIEVASAIPWTKLAGATRTLVGAGAAKDATRNLVNHLVIMDAAGPEAALRATGVTEREALQELSVSAVRGTDDFVPLSEPVAAHREAAEQAAREIFNSPEMSSFRSQEEMQAWVDGRIDEIRARIGSPIKDVKIETVALPGGRNVKQLTFTLGKKDGFGYASEAAAKRGLRATGFAGQLFQEAVERVVPRFESKAKIENLSFTTNKATGDKAYSFDVVREGSPDPVRVSMLVDTNGVGKMDVRGLDQGQFGPVEIRSLMAQVADEIPDLKTVTGPRTKGAREASGNIGDVATVDVSKLRGQTRVERDMSGQYFAKVTVDMPEAGWLVGKLEPPQQGFVSKMLGRYFQAAPRISDQLLHGQAIEGGSYLNRAQREIQTNVMGVFKKLDKQGKEVVGNLGRLSAIRERWLTRQEIDQLVDRQWGRPATEAEQKAYEDLRLFNDMDWELRNAEMYLDGVQKGKESVKFKTKWGQEVDEDVVIDYNMEKIPMERVYDASRGKHYVHGRNSLDTKTLTTMKNNGYVMASFPNGFRLPEGIVVNKVLIKKVDIEISPLRRTQLAYAEGGHRMYTSRNFVKQGRKGKQADTGSEYLAAPATFRTAENIAEARKWADKMNAARIAVKENRAITSTELDELVFKQDPAYPSGQEFLDGVIDETYDLEHPFEALFDRELPSMYNQSGMDVSRLFNEDELGINGYYRTTGRMYTSSKGEILRDTKGELADVLDPFDTLSRSLSQVTRKIGMFNYKMNAVERFTNTYKGFLASDPNIKSASQMLIDGKVAEGVSLEMKNQIEAQRAAILNVLRFETPADRAARQMWQATAEKIIGDGSSQARKFAHDAMWWWKDSDPIGALRGLAFDMKLGMFNVGQLLVQSSTMISAMAVSPKFGLQGMAGLFPMHAYILKGGSENVLDALAKRGVGKVMGFESVDEFKDYARHAYKHGFMEMNGSHIMINNYGPNAHFGSFGEKATRAREQARVFFYTSETWNRLVAYRIAWGEARKKGLTPNSPEFTSTILKTADDYSFNMTNESAAYWQKGILSIPTQFWAYNMRMMDAMFGKSITGWARARLIGANLGMAGAAGIPGLQALSEYIKQKNGKSPDIDSLAGVADRGIIDFINYKLTGNDVLIGERVGTGGWASDVVKSLTGNSEYGTQSFADIAGGATYSITKNTSKTLFNLAKYLAAENGDETVGPITTENLMNVLKEVSTFSNANKAMMIHQYGMLKSNTGTVLVSDLPPDHAIYTMLSFRPAKAEEIGYMLAWQKNKSENLKEISTKLRNWRQEALVTGQYEKYWTKANVLMRMVPIQDRREILRKTNATDQDSFYDYLEEKVSEEQTEEQMMEGLE